MCPPPPAEPLRFVLFFRRQHVGELRGVREEEDRASTAHERARHAPGARVRDRLSADPIAQRSLGFGPVLGTAPLNAFRLVERARGFGPLAATTPGGCALPAGGAVAP